MANQTTTTTSKQFSLNLSDWWKGLLMAILVPVIAVISDSISRGSLNFDWHLILVSAIGGLLAYLTKNWLTPSAIVIKNAPSETVDAVKSGEATVKVVNT